MSAHTTKMKLSLHCVSFCSTSLSPLQQCQSDRRKMKIFATQIGFALMKVISLGTKSGLICEIRIDADCSAAHFSCFSLCSTTTRLVIYTELYFSQTIFDNHSTCLDDRVSPQGSQTDWFECQRHFIPANLWLQTKYYDMKHEYIVYCTYTFSSVMFDTFHFTRLCCH